LWKRWRRFAFDSDRLFVVEDNLSEIKVNK